MFFRKKSKPQHRYSLPENRRIYAIGDVHGRLDLLEELLARIVRDDARRAAAGTMIVFLGDLVDRGPQSREVVQLVRTLCADGTAYLIKGNHEELFVNAARGDRAAARTFLAVGGDATLRSYGLGDEEIHQGSFADLAATMSRRIPEEDLDFLDSAKPCLRIGGYLFAHAGIEPDVDLAEQDEHDMRWIRERFTRSDRDHGVMVVHGHSRSSEIEMNRNRIGVDTGAYATGRLSAIGLEGADVWCLEANGSEPRDLCGSGRAAILRAADRSDSPSS